MSTVDVEVTIQPRGRSKQAASAPVRVPRITRLMALAIRFQDMIDRGEVRDHAEIARLGYVTRARMTQIMNLLHLAPDLQETLLDGRGETHIAERHLRSILRFVRWDEQRRAFQAMRGRPRGTSATNASI
jgi:hypothetical protein